MKGLKDVSLLIGIIASLLTSIIFVVDTQFHKNFKFSENSFIGMVGVIMLYTVIYYIITRLFALGFRGTCGKIFKK